MSHCFSSLQVCRLRAARLDASGVPAPGANNLYVTDTLIQLGMNLVLAAGASLELRTGCDAVCATFEDDDRIKGVTLTMELCELDAELFEILTGGNLLTDGADIIGYEVPDPDAAARNGVSLEVWTKAWDLDQQGLLGGGLAHWQFGFPRTVWVPGNIVLQNDILRVPLTGKGRGNANFYNGPGNDWPTPISNCFAFQITNDDLPASVCGRQTLAAS